MKNRILALVVVMAVIGFTTSAFAGRGMEHGGFGGHGECAALKNLSADDQQKVKAEQDAFLKDIEPLRQQIQQKHQDLKTELAKTDTDEQKAVAIVTDITNLMAQMGQKRLQHQLNLKKINPALVDCFGGGPGGFMGGPGGYGGFKGGCGGNCPNFNSTTPTTTTTTTPTM
jgi:Spy/CpxP family protein refolding chaperone